MAQSLSQTVRNTFNKGLLTEFSELNFPNEASIDELNCNILRSGNRTRRLGLSFETDSNGTTEQYVEGTLFSTATWYNVGNNPDTEYLVMQAGSTIRFFQKGASSLSPNKVPISDSNSNPYILDMSAFEFSGSLGAEKSAIEVTSINGYLVVASPQIDTFYIKQNQSDHSFSTSTIDFKVRDFGWFGFKEFYDVPIATSSVSIGRKYDTYNCGWTQDALDDYIASDNKWPPLTHPWYSGKNASGVFKVDEFNKIYGGTSIITNGHFILDLFDKNREAESGVTGINSVADEQTLYKRFNSVTSYAGRVFYSGIDSRIYFSQILEDTENFGELFSVNDPTSEYYSDLLDTDGGYVTIPEAKGIKKLHVFGSSLLVFADNGVWRISGVDDVFRATEYSVFRISDVGLAARKSFVSGANGQPFWWSYTGIHTIQVTDQGGLVETNISENTIKSFWYSIDPNTRVSVVGEYDHYNNSVVWLYPNNGETIEHKLNNLLILDTELGAFYPWKISDKSGSTPYIIGASFYNGAGSTTISFDVVDGSGNRVVDELGNLVTVDRELGSSTSVALKLMVRSIAGTVSFAEFISTDFVDWGTEDYDSYIECAYNFIGDLSRRKNSPYVTVFLRVTEEGWVDTGTGYDPIRPSSLKVSAYWDFKKTASSTAQEAYRYKYPLVVDPLNLSVFDYPTDVIATRLKLRGRGRVMRLRFEASAGKDFNLLGYETIDAANNIF